MLRGGREASASRLFTFVVGQRTNASNRAPDHPRPNGRGYRARQVG